MKMRATSLLLALWLIGSGVALLAPDGAQAGGAMGPTTGTPRQPPVVVKPRTPLSPAVPSKNAYLRAKLIAEIKEKYAVKKNFLTARCAAEQQVLLQELKRVWDNPGATNRVMKKLKALGDAYHSTINDLDQRRDAEIRGVLAAQDLTR